MSSINAGLVLQITHQQSDDNAKCPPKQDWVKNVTWATHEKLIQVRLFAAEDAPSLSGMVSQDLLEAKKAKLTHASSFAVEQLPSGFGSATKRAKIDTIAISEMVAQVNWKCPKRFLSNPSWLVAAGDESFEVSVQQHREVRVLEAFYPRISAIPASSIEPPEAAASGFNNSHPPQIPLLSSEDEDEELEVTDAISGDIKEVARSALSPANKVTISELSASYTPLNNAESSDPDIAAAAAAAFAVLKAQESGSLIDRDLLIKILSNPLLLQACNTHSWNQLEDTPYFIANEMSNNGNGLITKHGKGTYSSGALGSLSSHIKQERERYADLEEKDVLWEQRNPMQRLCGLNGGLLHSPGISEHEKGQLGGLNGGLLHNRGILEHGKGILGHGKDAFRGSTPMEQSKPLRSQDISRKIFPRSPLGNVMTNEALRQRVPPRSFHEGKSRNEVDQVRAATITGLNCPPLLESNPSAAGPAISRKSLATRDKLPGIKIKRQCFFFNTLKGCRNGIHCNFSHDPAHVEPYLEKVNLPDSRGA